MPADIECTACKLAFSVGTYHYHSFDDGYIGSTLLVCGKTGRQHRLEIPHPDRSLAFALESMSSVLIAPKRLAGTMIMLPDDDWARRRIISTRVLADIACDCCSELGTLIDAANPGMRCPNCGEILPRPVAEWMT
jgi:hypothetical protein